MSTSSSQGPKRFVAATATEALSMVKQAIGPDAILLSNREVEGGIEIIAMAQEQFKELGPRASSARSNLTGKLTAPKRFDDFPAVSSTADRAPRPEGLRLQSDTAIRTANHKLIIADVAQSPMRNLDGSPVFAPDVAAAHFRSETGSSIAKDGPSSATTARNAQVSVTSQPQARDSEDLNALAERLMGQVNEVKELLQSHLAGNTWSQLKGVSPGRAELLKKLLAVGFSPGLATSLLEEVGEVQEGASLIKAIRPSLAKRIKTLDPVSLFDSGGVFAFIGPTGVGKTTTVAKIAARCVMRFGRKSVSLLSTDTYRIGALEQLRVFGKILGLPVTALRDADDLAARIQELERFHVVLIDTAGMGQRDVKMVDQLRVLSDGYKAAQRLLVMSATTSLQTMQDVIQAHSQGQNNGIKAAVVTKIDEAMSLAPSVDCLVRHNLPILFIGNGQQVPEDLHVADSNYLAHRSLQPRLTTAALEPEDHMIPAMIADTISSWAKKK